MIQGKRFPFAEEAERLFGVRPVLKSLAAYDAELAKAAAMVHGDGTLAARVEAKSDRLTNPKERREKVFDDALARCRRSEERRVGKECGRTCRNRGSRTS